MAPGGMDSEAESEKLEIQNPKETVITKSSATKDKPEEDKDLADKKLVDDSGKASKATGIALPITEMTDDWMDDGQALGSMDSEDEEDTTKSKEKQDSAQVSPPKVVSSPDPKPYKPTPSPYKEEAPVKRSPDSVPYTPTTNFGKEES